MPAMHLDREPLIREVCKRLSLGEPLAQICRDAHMPGVTTVWEWAKASKEFTEAIAYARELGFDAIAEECMEIADDKTRDFKPSDKGPAFDGEHVQRSKLRIETRLKLLAKWDPKRYGEKQQVEMSGAVDMAAILESGRKRSGIAG